MALTASDCGPAVLSSDTTEHKQQRHSCTRVWPCGACIKYGLSSNTMALIASGFGAVSAGPGSGGGGRGQQPAADHRGDRDSRSHGTPGGGGGGGGGGELLM